MSKLTEKYVQDASLSFLKSYYKAKYNLDAIFARKEVTTKFKNIKGRADGLIAFKKKNESIYTVSLEAKSHKTFSSLLTINKNMGYFGFGFLFLILSFIFIHFSINSNSLLARWVFPGILSLILTFALLFIFQYFALFEEHGIIEQVRRYPANEKWIAISKDAFNFYNRIDDNELLFRAKKYKIGILVVSSRQKVEILQEPKEEKSKKYTDYLKYYSIGVKIKTILTTKQL